MLGNLEVLAETTTNFLTYTATGLDGGTEYTFYVAAKNFVGIGANSPPLVQLAASVPDQPQAPTVSATYNSVSLSWSALVAPANGGV